VVPTVFNDWFGRRMTKVPQDAIEHLRVIFHDLEDRRFIEIHGGKWDQSVDGGEGSGGAGEILGSFDRAFVTDGEMFDS
jgi:hypothetical protein